MSYFHKSWISTLIKASMNWMSHHLERFVSTDNDLGFYINRLMDTHSVSTFLFRQKKKKHVQPLLHTGRIFGASVEYFKQHETWKHCTRLKVNLSSPDSARNDNGELPVLGCSPSRPLCPTAKPVARPRGSRCPAQVAVSWQSPITHWSICSSTNDQCTHTISISCHQYMGLVVLPVFLTPQKYCFAKADEVIGKISSPHTNHYMLCLAGGSLQLKPHNTWKQVSLQVSKTKLLQLRIKYHQILLIWLTQHDLKETKLVWKKVTV